MNNHAVIPGSTKRAQVARALLTDINSGKYPIDTLLPAENILAEKFGVSRQTVRAALSSLRDLGVTEGRQGTGNYVRSSQPASRYAYSVDSALDLLQYATTTTVHVLSCKEILLNESQANSMKRKSGEAWWQIQTVRAASGDKQPIASSQILIPWMYSAVLQHLDKTHEPIFVLIQKLMQETLSEIRQTISATSISAEDALVLGVPASIPGLCIERQYFDKNAELFEISRSIHPADIFSYSMRVRLSAS